MGNVQVAMLAGALYTLLRDAVFTHPTMSESLGMLFAPFATFCRPMSGRSARNVDSPRALAQASEDRQCCTATCCAIQWRLMLGFSSRLWASA